ncbi:probable ATP-dependent RNA helicase DHX34 isoform X1 [Mizuhopecten yessoensis]|uniref:ATP-dependent RNA helicase DHX34 n=2 Tax=Mizuhopecten yessoensis TaxID=6573 RepID=A0A210QZB1_MIZYE|nr:probable ATP-dependent RNA helicase DHX34 isoform X1 [Mizuhopecten yessoensis]OWF54057.1 ATP-dependent RNA helicase DHX34 [Mizuhopecten yessoensis]
MEGERVKKHSGKKKKHRTSYSDDNRSSDGERHYKHVHKKDKKRKHRHSDHTSIQQCKQNDSESDSDRDGYRKSISRKSHRSRDVGERHKHKKYTATSLDAKEKEIHRSDRDPQRESGHSKKNTKRTHSPSTSEGYHRNVTSGNRQEPEDVNSSRGYSSRRRSRSSSDSEQRHSSQQDTAGKSSSESDGPKEPFDFRKHRYSLNKIFFNEDDFIKRETKQYDDFWTFLEKYQAFQQKKGHREKEERKEPIKEGKLGLPRNYDKRYRINVALTSKVVEDFLKKGRLVDADIARELTVKRVSEFRSILLHYIDFIQKQKFNKLKKIKKDQENLPIFQYRQRILDMVNQHQVIVVAGDTGCGKSTQVPQYLMAGGFTNIACTQPRRIACISLSKRVGYETLNEYGSEVAYQVRFEKTKTRFTRILFLTEGLLLRQMTSDPHLKQYSVIVIDEVHERHIHTDFLLGILKCMLRHRDDIKLILMSATINIHLFSGYFDDAPVVKVPGRLYPIQLEYCPIRRDEVNSRAERLDPSPYLRVMQKIDHKCPENERGDLLIFLSGMTEIMTVVEAAKIYAEKTKKWIILPLHSSLSISEQDKVFDIAPEGVRKCIISTNIAETSVTIDGVRFIADSGKVKEMNFDPKYKMQKLQEFWISRASAEQRKGRAGRTGPGVCYRLYEEKDYDEFQEFATPEIQRVPLDSLVLQMISMGLPDARKFPFLEAPEMSSIENSIIFLKEQGALRGDETLTPIGQMLSRLPVDVVIGKMLIMGSIFHITDPVLSIAAAMSVQSPFTSKAHSDHDAISARKPLESEHGDPFTLLNAFDEWIQVKADGRGTRKWCKRRALEEQRFYEMTKLKDQFKQLLRDHNLLDNTAQSERFYTSDERRKQHANRKRLGQLKRENANESKRRKVLKLEDGDYTISDGEEDDKGEDIKDLEFRLSHDIDKLHETSNKNRNFSRRDVNLLKIILCSGLYPQVAIADDCNSYKSDSEQSFHTKSKPFILLHPTSVFACHPDLLQVEEYKGDTKTPRDLQGKLNHKHQLLTFVSLLETTKPYLMNTMRVPALQTTTLFSNFIDTNSDCTRLVCDGWLEIRFPDEESAQHIMSSVIQLRATWQNLLTLRLQDTFKSLDSEKRINPRARKLEKLLAGKLAEYLASEVPYAVRRIMSAELKNLYKGPGQEANSNKDNTVVAGLMGSDYGDKEHSTKGGTQINYYITYDCLLDDSSASVWGEYTSHMVKHWTCPRCNASLLVNVLERLRHEAECHSQNIEATKDEDENDLKEEKESQLNHMRKAYHCSVCEKDYNFTTTEILKHRRSHVNS